jgi:pimeloyl-ACP methyl ester carboxylesterase
MYPNPAARFRGHEPVPPPTDPDPAHMAGRPRIAGRKLLCRPSAAQSGGAGAVRHETVHVGGAEMAVFRIADDSNREAPLLIWAHGWGHTHANLLPLAEAMQSSGRSVLLDFPGFGASPLPPEPWGTAEYADACAEWLATLPPGRRIWVAHSFGCRVGLQLAARHLEAIHGLFLIAAAGLQPRRSLKAGLRFAARRWAFRLARSVVPEGPARERLRRRFGSADYARAGPLRPILSKTVAEDLSEVAERVRCPTALVYGEQDRETPPEIGERLQALIPDSRLYVLRGFDHWSVLTEGRHQLTHRLAEFVEGRA